MTAIAQFVREYLLAVQFFTRIPITGRLANWVGYSPELLRASAGHFPGIGILAGAFAGLSLTLYLLIDELPPGIVSFTPHLTTLLVLSLASQRLRMPQADGLIYRRGEH